MPEGPEIKRAADRIAKVIGGRIVQAVQVEMPGLAVDAPSVEGKRVVRIAARGKALLIYIGESAVLYSHNQLYGRWYTTRPGSSPRTNRRLRIAIHTVNGSAWLYSASDVRVMTRETVEDLRYIKRLGPDPLEDQTSADDLLARMDDPAFSGRALGGLLLDQGFIAGIGNYLRSEILYRAGLHPRRRPRDLSETDRAKLANTTLQLTRQAYETGGVTNDLDRVDELIRDGAKRREYRHWVFSRAGRRCYECNTPIEKINMASRRLYWCATCQPS